MLIPRAAAASAGSGDERGLEHRREHGSGQRPPDGEIEAKLPHSLIARSYFLNLFVFRHIPVLFVPSVHTSAPAFIVSWLALTMLTCSSSIVPS